MKSNNRYKINNIKNPSFRIILMTFATMLAAVGGLMFLSISQSMVSEKSTEIVHYETVNKEYISKISQDMSMHQAVIFQYMINAGDSVRQTNLISARQSSITNQYTVILILFRQRTHSKN